jgi:hypothetical protein
VIERQHDHPNLDPAATVADIYHYGGGRWTVYSNDVVVQDTGPGTKIRSFGHVSGIVELREWARAEAEWKGRIAAEWKAREGAAAARREDAKLFVDTDYLRTLEARGRMQLDDGDWDCCTGDGDSYYTEKFVAERQDRFIRLVQLARIGLLAEPYVRRVSQDSLVMDIETDEALDMLTAIEKLL